MKVSYAQPAFRITLIYAVIAMAWIGLSDWLIAAYVFQPKQITLIQMVKGGLFVLVTAGILYGLIVHRLSEMGKVQEKLKEAQNRLQLLNTELEQRVSQRTAELAASEARLEKANQALFSANQRLKEIDRLKSLFIASMSHELRTPLNSIIGFTGVILKGMAGSITDKQQDYLRRVLTSGKHLLALINDVIDISKIEAGKVEFSPATFDLRDFVREAVEQVSCKAQKKGLSVSTEVPPGANLHTDRNRLLQCLLNYLDNAVKYTESGSIEVRARLETSQIVFEVEDTGIGIEEEDKTKLFQAFSRIHSPCAQKEPSTGLGLYITRKLAVEVLHGSVGVTSQPEKGSIFTLTVPRTSMKRELSSSHSVSQEI